MPVAVGIGSRDETVVLDFLIDGVLQHLVELQHFGFRLDDVIEFDFTGDTEAVAAVSGQAEFYCNWS